MENTLVPAEDVESVDTAEVDFVSQIRPRVSSIVKAPTPVSPNPQHTGIVNHFFSFQQLLNYFFLRRVYCSWRKSR